MTATFWPEELFHLAKKARTQTLLVLPASSPLEPPPGVDFLRRPDDWNVGRLRKWLNLLRWSALVAWRSRAYERVLIVTGGIELLLLSRWVRTAKLVAVDWIMPTFTRFDRWADLSAVKFYIVRRSDAGTLHRRFGVLRGAPEFAPFPAPQPSGPSIDNGYAYSAGWAHRDWDTLFDAQARNGLPLVAAGTFTNRRALNLRQLPPLSPKDGREMLRGARYVALAMLETELPSGPLVLLDAFAHGKAVIVSDVGGARDYIEHEVNALVVPAGDVGALDLAMRRLNGDSALRARLGVAAADKARSLTIDQFWALVLAKNVDCVAGSFLAKDT